MSKIGYKKYSDNAPFPFLRWAGGKTWLVKDFQVALPADFNNYFEPFLGGGSFFLFLQSIGMLNDKEIILSDYNSDLINAYRVLKEEPKKLIASLKKYENSEEEYYRIRSKVFRSSKSNASKFIYLNRTSFNGIYRVNKKGQYNVPYGFKNYNTLFDFENLNRVSALLQNVQLLDCDFEEIVTKIGPKDLIFIDPPYTVAHGKNGFLKYNQKIFSWDDQIRLLNFIKHITKIGAYYIMTNAAHESVDKLFKEESRKIFKRASVVGGKGAKREFINEYMYLNF